MASVGEIQLNSTLFKYNNGQALAWVSVNETIVPLSLHISQFEMFCAFMPEPVNKSRDSSLREEYVNCITDNQEVNFGQVAIDD